MQAVRFIHGEREGGMNVEPGVRCIHCTAPWDLVVVKHGVYECRDASECEANKMRRLARTRAHVQSSWAIGAAPSQKKASHT